MSGETFSQNKFLMVGYDRIHIKKCEEVLKKVPKSIYLTPELAYVIEQRAGANSRTFAGEIEFILKKQFQSELNKLSVAGSPEPLQN